VADTINRLVHLALIRTLVVLFSIASFLYALNGNAADRYARDDRTELSVDLPTDAATPGTFSLRRYSDKPSQDDAQFDGSVKLDGSTYQSEPNRDQPGKLTARVGGDGSLEVESSGFAVDKNQPIDFNGTYRKLSSAEALARAQAREDEADRWLNETYSRLKASLPANRFSIVQADQRDWISYRDYMAENIAAQEVHEEGPEQNAEILEQKRGFTLSRISFLNTTNDPYLPSGLTAVYDDGQGGVLQLDQDGKNLQFSISVVRGPTYHTGDISGVAKRQKDGWFYREKPPYQGDGPAELTFTPLDDRRIKVTEKKTDAFHGARAYFAATYYKQKALVGGIKEGGL
jgi:uncharacterized protein YecT (DUF1311 family)